MTRPRAKSITGPAAVLATLLVMLLVAPSADAVTGYRYSRSFGSSGQGKLAFPGRLAAAPTTNDLFVTDLAAGLVQRFNKSGDYVSTIDVRSHVSFDRSTPPFIAIDPGSGDFYVSGIEPPPAGSDQSSGQPVIARFHATGGYVSTIDLSQAGVAGVTQLGGLAVDSASRLDVFTTRSLSDGSSTNEVQVFSPAGARTASFDGSTGPGAFVGPGFPAVGAGNSVYVLDYGAGVEKFSAPGAGFQGGFQPDGFDGLAVDSGNGDVFIQGTPGNVSGVTRFTASGTRQARFGEIRGVSIGGIAVDPASHTVFETNPHDPGNDTTPSSVDVYVPFAAPAVTTTDGATAVTGRSARVAGSVNPQGRATTYAFEYSLDPNATDVNSRQYTTDPVGAGSGTGNVQASAALTGLQPNRTYYYRLRATNDLGSNFGEPRTFSTDAIPPTISDGSVSGVTSTRATLGAVVNPENSGTTAHFEYGTTDAYGTQTPERQVGLGDTQDASTLAAVENLAPSTTYHYRLVASNGVGSGSASADRTFTTASVAPAVGASGDAAQFSAAANTGGLAGRVSFLVTGVNSAYTASSATQDLPAASGPRSVTGSVTGLPAGGTYIVRLRVETTGGVVLSDPATFSTDASPAQSPPASLALPPFSLGCTAPRLAQPRGAFTPGGSATLFGSDLGAGGHVTFGSREVKITRYATDRITVVVPSRASGRVPVVVSCGRASNAVIARVRTTTPSNRFGVSTRSRGSRATVRIAVPARGAVSVSGRYVARRSAKPSKSGAVRLTVSLTGAGRAALARATSKSLRASIAIRYRPSGGAARTAKRTLVFRRR